MRQGTMRTEAYQEEQVLLVGENVLITGHDAEMMMTAIDDDVVSLLCLYRGVIVEPRTVEVTMQIVTEREFRFGFDGAERERCAKRAERVVDTKPRQKLWHTKKRGWYWIEVSDREDTAR